MRVRVLRQRLHQRVREVTTDSNGNHWPLSQIDGRVVFGDGTNRGDRRTRRRVEAVSELLLSVVT